MNLGQTVLSQLIEHLPHKEFQKCVARYRGDLEELLLLGSVSRHGFRTIDLHGEPPRYRNLPTVHAEQAVSELPVSTPATEATPTCSRLTDGADGEPNSTRREHQAHSRAQRQGLNPNPS